MKIVASVGMANNFAAVRSLVTKGIQIGHMKMHLYNILNHIEATKSEKEKAVEYFVTNKVSHGAVQNFIDNLRKK
jgi:hydroxymethylglutaryl-CoA reductase